MTVPARLPGHEQVAGFWAGALLATQTVAACVEPDRKGDPLDTAHPFNRLPALGEFLRAEGFELLREADEPLVIREHARKYQYIVAHATLWRRVE